MALFADGKRESGRKVQENMLHLGLAFAIIYGTMEKMGKNTQMRRHSI